MKKNLTLLAILLCLFPAVSIAFELVPVPYIANDPNIPHPTFNDRLTTFKVSARGQCTERLFRWDFDGDGIWDTGWQAGNYIEGTHYLPRTTTPTVFQAKVEASCDGTVAYATYPVISYPDIPSKDEAATASKAQLDILTAVAIDDALWYLHKNLTRILDNSSQIRGYLHQAQGAQSANTLAASALYLLALEENGHLPAYPPNTYNSFNETIPLTFIDENNHRWLNDPYSEDAIRLFNYLASNISSISVPAIDEADDNSVPIEGTNDGIGYKIGTYETDYNAQSLSLRALSKSVLQGTLCQVGPTYVLGRSIEFIVQQLVDYGVAAQIDESSPEDAIGGWSNQPCFNCNTGVASANSFISGGWYIALQDAEEQMGSEGVYVNQRAKNRLPNMLYYNQHSTGGAKYTNSSMAPSFESTGLALLGCRWLGWDLWQSGDASSANYPYLNITKGSAKEVCQAYVDYIGEEWTKAGGGSFGDQSTALWSDGDFNSTAANAFSYSISNVKLGANYSPEITSFGTHDWRREFSVNYVKHQENDGSFRSASIYWLNSFLDRKAQTAYAVISLTPSDESPVVPEPRLTVAVVGEGTISDFSINEGMILFLSCQHGCSETFETGTRIAITATPESGHTLTSWVGCDSVSGTVCSVQMSHDRTVTATFNSIDQDGDDVPDATDNCPAAFNPDQSDIDGDGSGDVCDLCPSDATDSCNTACSGGGSVNEAGGNVSTGDGSVQIVVPPGAVAGDTSISITESGQGSFELSTNLGNGLALYGVELRPEGAAFGQPVTLIFSWPDTDNDGIVDDTNIREERLIITKGNEAVTDRCFSDARCDMAANTFTIETSEFSPWALVGLANTTPSLGAISTVTAPQPVGTAVAVSAAFVDAGGFDTHMADIDWGDGTLSPGSIEQTGTGGMISGSHTYYQAGVYVVAITCTDSEGLAGSVEYRYIVVYDPSAGFVTGGGWIDSPAGAYAAAPTLTGKANFGFVSRYQKGSSTPTGRTEFQFHAGDFDFRSDTYEWLVIAGAKASYKGVGTIKGLAGTYKFLLTAIDAEQNKNDSFTIDRFRIKVWSEDDAGIEKIVYDNGLGATDDEEGAPQVIGGGSVVIHK